MPGRSDHPIAIAALDLLLDATRSAGVEAGLIIESATYSLLQAGPEHQAWLAAHPRRLRTEPQDDAVLVSRDASTLRVTLNRPHVHNAYNAAMREGLLDALTIAVVDDTIAAVVLDGNGPSFCSGGDLDEFGTSADPASAHLLRVERSAGRAVHQLRERTSVFVHGACVGAGVEIPAFAARVVARRGTTFRLPEIAMGLVPGAGGTVSIPRRIGPDRFREMALSGEPIDATTALEWGLIDEIAP